MENYKAEQLIEIVVTDGYDIETFHVKDDAEAFKMSQRLEAQGITDIKKVVVEHGMRFGYITRWKFNIDRQVFEMIIRECFEIKK